MEEQTTNVPSQEPFLDPKVSRNIRGMSGYTGNSIPRSYESKKTGGSKASKKKATKIVLTPKENKQDTTET